MTALQRVRGVFGQLATGVGLVHIRTETSNDKDNVLVVKPMSCVSINHTSSNTTTASNGVCVETDHGTRTITSMMATTTTTSCNTRNSTTTTTVSTTTSQVVSASGHDDGDDNSSLVEVLDVSSKEVV